MDSTHSDDPLIYESIEGVAWITMNRPSSRNALNAPLRRSLWTAFRRFADDDSARVAILEGAGTIFCAGGDLKEMRESKLTTPPADYLPHLNRNIHTEKPVIAAVQGAALGGGFLLAQMADLCIAVEDAEFGITEARWGRGAPWAAPLSWLVPPRAALELLMTARPIPAKRAYEIGLVNKVVPAEELKSEARDMAGTIAVNAPLSVRAARSMVYSSAELGLSTALDRADEIFRPVYESYDAQEGPRAFAEGRSPRWRGA